MKAASPAKERSEFDSPSKIIAQKKRDLNKPFQSKIDKKILHQSRMALLLSSSNASNALRQTSGSNGANHSTAKLNPTGGVGVTPESFSLAP